MDGDFRMSFLEYERIYLSLVLVSIVLSYLIEEVNIRLLESVYFLSNILVEWVVVLFFLISVVMLEMG